MIQHLTDLTIHLIFASIHTTTEISTTVLYRLLQHPELIPELLEEQDQVLHSFLGEDVVKSTDDAATLFTYDVVHNLPKLDSLCRESIRLRNDYLIMSHKYIGKNKFTFSNGAVIKPGEYIIINSWYNHRAEEVQQDNTDDHFEFQPFRYANLPDRQATKIGSDYLIFGLGKNACPVSFRVCYPMHHRHHWKKREPLILIYTREFRVAGLLCKKSRQLCPSSSVNTRFQTQTALSSPTFTRKRCLWVTLLSRNVPLEIFAFVLSLGKLLATF